MYMNIKDIIKDLDAVQMIELKNYLTDELSNICGIKKSNSMILENNSNAKVCSCGCIMSKNGHTKTGVQKYKCPGCLNTCCETTGTVVYHSKLSFEIWKNVIDNLINGFSIRRITEENNISVLTSFNLRHKVLIVIKKYVKHIRLQGTIQSDEKYFKINLKGTKPNNMPRFSKKRTTKGISYHQICVVSSIDENDNLLLQITDLGRCTTKMLQESLGSKLKKAKAVNVDSASAYQQFCCDNNLKLNAIPSGFHSDGIINILEINGVHSQLETWFSKFRGISTRHLQEYLDWFVYIFTMKKKFTLKNLKTNSYKEIIVNNNYIDNKSICNIPVPIDLNIAYVEYNHQ